MNKILHLILTAVLLCGCAEEKVRVREDFNDGWRFHLGDVPEAYAADYDDRMKLLSIEEREGEFPGMLEERTFNIIPVSKNGVGKTQTVKYNGLSMKVVL